MPQPAPDSGSLHQMASKRSVLTSRCFEMPRAHSSLQESAKKKEELCTPGPFHFLMQAKDAPLCQPRGESAPQPMTGATCHCPEVPSGFLLTLSASAPSPACLWLKMEKEGWEGKKENTRYRYSRSLHVLVI